MACQNLCFNSILCSVILATMKSASFFAEAKSNKPFLISLGTLCNMTTYPNTCYTTLAPLVHPKHVYDWRILYNLSVQVVKTELLAASTIFAPNGTVSQIVKDHEKRLELALGSSRKLLDLAMYHLNWVILGHDGLAKVETRRNIRTWLTGVGALLQTCKDEFDYTPFVVQEFVILELEISSRTVSNSLAIIYEIGKHIHGETEHMNSDWPPTWLSIEDKTLFENSKLPNEPDIVVAADGSGNYSTISAALDAVPPNSNRRFIIYVKAGVYTENVAVAKEKWNVFMYGDGMDKTVVTSSRSNSTGTPTFQTATFGMYTFR